MADLAFFRRALASFAASASKFDVVCSVTGPTLARPLAPPPPVHTLVVLDASFNPPTTAHMRMAASAVHDLQATLAANSTNTTNKTNSTNSTSLRLLLLLSVNNADKAPKPAAFEQRLALMHGMAQDMQKGEPLGVASDIAIDIGLTSEPYFHDKSAALAAAPFYSAHTKDNADTHAPPAQLFLVGYDTLVRVFDPKYYADGLHAALGPFLRRARLRVTTRPDDQWGTEAAQRAWATDHIDAAWAPRIDLVSANDAAGGVVSSTAARAAAQDRNWVALKGQVSSSVAAWIQQHSLYSE